MGGTLTLDSIAGMGSVFTATVPLIPFRPFDPPRDTRAAAMPRNTVAFILCHEPDMEQRLIETLQLRGWSPRAMASLDAAIHALRTMRPPAFVLVNDDYRRDAAQRLHAAGAVPVIRTASEGPRHPAACGEGCLEVTEYSHRALLEAIDIAMKHRATDFSRIDMSPGNSGVSRSLHNTSTPYA
jgi:two-component system capsular synthesis sensor histidine kinase RcsC